MYPYSQDDFEAISKTDFSELIRKNDKLTEKGKPSEGFASFAPLRPKKWKTCCPQCGSNDLIKKEDTIQTYWDIDESKNVVEVKIHDVRCKCKNCGHTFQKGIIPGEMCNNKYSDDLLNAAIDEMLDYDTTLKDVAEKYKIKSASTLAAELHKRAQAAMSHVESMKLCEHFIAYPFEYNGDTCYALWGIIDIESRHQPREEFLYDIRKGYTPDDLKDFIVKHPFEDDEIPYADWADTTKPILDVFPRVHKDVNVAILHSFIEKMVREYKFVRGNTSGSVIRDKREDLLGIIQRGPEENFYAELDEWRRNLSYYDVDGHYVVATGPFSELYKRLIDDRKFIENTMSFSFLDESLEEYDYDIMKYNMRFVPKFNKARIPFEDMRFRILKCIAAKNNQGIPMKQLLRNSYGGPKLTGYYIDLKMVNELFADIEE